MLDLVGKAQPRFCDGISRRNFLRIGGLALGGMSLPEVLRAESLTAAASGQAVSRSTISHKGVIMIFLAGGPPHQDMFDLKPEAPAEIRGEFTPIRTNVPGIEICELFPRMATMMDKFAIIRSLKGCVDRHEPHQCFSGYTSGRNLWPCVGSFLAKIKGPADSAVPPFVGLSPKTQHAPWGNSGEPAWLGPQYAAFRPDDGPGMQNMVLNQQVSLDRLQDRKALLARVDFVRRSMDAAGQLAALDTYTEQAFNVLTSSKLVEALDLEKEDQKLRDRYGRGTKQFVDDGPWRLLDQFLIARRLICAGVRCVTLAFSRWDWHGGNFTQGRRDMPMLDQGLSALVEDIHNRGLDKDISVVVWGEFGRTPKINSSAGRDHWPNANFVVLAGGGMRTGQVIGATDRTASVPVERPIHPQEVLATLYHRLGINLSTTTVTDATGRPQHLLDYRDPIRELV
jgi:hypothetical protein